MELKKGLLPRNKLNTYIIKNERCSIKYRFQNHSIKNLKNKDAWNHHMLSESVITIFMVRNRHTRGFLLKKNLHLTKVILTVLSEIHIGFALGSRNSIKVHNIPTVFHSN